MAKASAITKQFLGLNTERPVNKLASGTARVARNVRLESGMLEGRPGFGEFDANPDGLTAIISGCYFPNTSGDIYLVVKRTGGSKAGLDYARVYDASTGAMTPGKDSWTDIVDPWSGHNNLDRGWWFVHADRVCHDDRTGMTKWHITTANKPAPGTAPIGWKGGIQGNIGPTISAISGGAMHGNYFVGVVLKNAVTGELSCIQDLQAEAVLVDQGAGNGGLQVTNGYAGGAIQTTAASLLYEWDTVQLVSSMGNSEKTFGANSPTFRLWFDTSYAKGAYPVAVPPAPQTYPALGISDATRGTRLRHTDLGGPPPPAQHGAYNGSRAVYGGCWYNSALVGGQVAFSLQGYPTMVPGDHTYSAGGVSLTWAPAAELYNGFINSAVSGITQAIRPVGNKWIVWTDSGSHWLVPLANGALYPQSTGIPGGCVGDEIAAASPYGAYALGTDVWWWASERGLVNIARGQFTPTLEEIPATGLSFACMAAYTARHEIWAAVARTNYSGPNSIICETYAVGGSTYRNIGTAAANATRGYQLFPDVPAEWDAIWFGYTAKPTAIDIYTSISRPGLYDEADVLEWGYYDNRLTGSTVWAALTAYDVGALVKDSGEGGDGLYYTCHTTRDDSSSDHPAEDRTHWDLHLEALAVTDGTNPDEDGGGQSFIDDGHVTAASPAHWAELTVNSVEKYYVRVRIAKDKAKHMTRVPILTAAGATRILVYDEDRQELQTTFDPRNLLGASIAWMCEMNRPSDSPALMLLMLNDGRILYYPTTGHADTEGENSYNFSTEWEGYFGQEYRHREASDVTLTIHTGAMARRVGVTVTGLKTGAEDLGGSEALMEGENDVLIEGVAFDAYRNGRLFKVRFATTASELGDGAGIANSPDWQIVDVILNTN